MTFQEIPVNAARICDGLRKIGYTPATAITDIVDNSVQARALNIYIMAVPEVSSEVKRNNIKEYLIIDDGIGMDSDGIESALTLGSVDVNYGVGSLSKFGLGLKSAAFSQGEVLEVISGQGDGAFQKYQVSLPLIRQIGKYGAMKVSLSDDDERLISKYLLEKRGTIIRIAEVRKVNHPSIRSTFEDLRMKLGVVYYYMMQEDGLTISLVDIGGTAMKCTPYDVLFTGEADTNGDLDENSWDGRKVQWIERPRELTLDPEMGVSAEIAVTQLPYPPVYSLDTPDRQTEIRNQYMISAGNYGYYVYRNRRLLSWVESFGIIPQDQDYYAFRGRIRIDESADEVFNIDVKKSQLHPSEVALQAIDDASYEYKRKSKRAWNTAKAERARRMNEDSLSRANEIANEIGLPDELPGDITSQDDIKEIEKRQDQLAQQQELKKESIARRSRNTSSHHIDTTPPSDEEIKDAVIGSMSQPDDRIHLVDNILDNVLWEPLYFAGRDCVRINRLHRFSTLIYEGNKSNSSLTVFLNLFLLNLAGAEFYVQRNFRKYPREQVEEILQEFRRVTTDFLATLVRQGSGVLPSE